MDVNWLEDFLAVAETGNFSRASARRGIAQPALSRRIQALERWIGTPLFQRTSRRVDLTRAGERFRPFATEVLLSLIHARQDALEAAQGDQNRIKIASTHTLAQVFFPAWLMGLEQRVPIGPVQLIADTMEGCEQILRRGEAHFLLYHHHATTAVRLCGMSFSEVELGADEIVPISAPDREGRPLHPLEGGSEPLHVLSYASSSGLGRILASGSANRRGRQQVVFTSHLAAALKALALEGRGMAWLPKTLVAADLDSGTLVLAGSSDQGIRVAIKLMRPSARQSPAAEAMWSLITSS